MFRSFASFVLPATLWILSLSLPATAEERHDHTETICSAQNAQLCAHLGLHKTLKSTEAGQFIAHFFTPDNAPVSNLKVTLWMPDMGHGSSPVTLQEVSPHHFLVSEAWFLMPGKWLVQMQMDYAGSTHQIDIPLEITE